jgi:hypothetical protein
MRDFGTAGHAKDYRRRTLRSMIRFYQKQQAQ